MNGTMPEPGQLVEVRRRHWIVSDVDAAAVAPELPKRNLVKLASIDEDALGEEIEVLWELEPGAHVIERAGLPTIAAGASRRTAPAAFLELVAPPTQSFPECTIELEGRSGKLRICVNGAPASYLAALSRELWESAS